MSPDRRRRTSAARLALALLVTAAAAAAQVPNWPREAPPRPLPARPFKFPPYEARTLPNGLQIIVVPHHEQPAVTMRLLVRAGSAQDPTEQAGLADLVAELLDQGTATRSAQEIADQIDSIGGAMGTGSGTDLTFANVIVMRDSFELAMNLLHDVVRNPAFAPDEIDRQKQQAISALSVNANDPDYVASALFDRLVYGFHPYGRPGTGTPESIGAITRDDLVQFHRRYFVPNNMILAIVGDITTAEAFAAAEKVFGGWPRGESPAWQPAEPPPPTRRIIAVDKPDAVQTEIRVGQLAIPRKHPDYLAWDLAVKILGGEGANRLHRVLRSERGLTYGAEAETQAMKWAGDFVAETDTRTETTGEALRLIVEEIGRLQRQRVSERELADAQAYLTGSFPLTVETPNDIATQVLNAVFYELPLEELSTFRERVQAITPDDIQRVAREYIRPDRLSIVLVGNARAFVPQLRAVGFTDIEVIPIAELDLTSATLRREPLRVRNDRESLPGGAAPSVNDDARPPRAAYTSAQASPLAGREQPSAIDLVRRAIEAKGGLDRLRALRTLVADAVMELRTPQGSASVPTRTYIVYPDRFRLDTLAPGQETTLVYNRGQVWMQDRTGITPAPPRAHDDAAASVRRDVVLLLLAAADGKVPVRLVADREGAGHQGWQVVEFETAHAGPVRLYLDEQLNVVRQTYTTRGPSGERIAGEEIFSDFRTVEGVSLAFDAEVVRDGRPILKRTLARVTINGPVPDRLFTRPQ